MISLFVLFLSIILAYLLGGKGLNIIKYQTKSFLENVILSINLGYGILAIILFVFGIFGLFYHNFIKVLLIIILIVLLSLYGRKELSLIKSHLNYIGLNKSINIWAIFFILIVYCGYNLLRCLTPILNADSLAIYISIPDLYVQNHGIYDINWADWKSSLPMYILLVNVLGLLLDSDILSQLISGWLFGILSAVLIYAIVKNIASKRVAFISAAVFYTLPTISWLIFSTKIDLGWAMFELSFWLLFLQWVKTNDRQQLYISAFFLGLAIGSKYHSLLTLFFIGIAIIVFMMNDRERIEKIIKTTINFSLISLIVGSPSYIKNVIYKNNPVYPFGSSNELTDNSTLETQKSLIGYFEFTYNVIFEKDFFAVPMSLVDSPIGILPILFIPFIFYGFRKNSVYVKRVVILLVLYYIFSSLIIYHTALPRPRHFLPAIGLLIVVNAVGLKNAFELLNYRLLFVVIIITMVFTVIISNIQYKKNILMITKDQISYILKIMSKNDYLKKYLYDTDNYHMNSGMINYVKSMDPNIRIITLDAANNYYVKRPFLKRNYVYSINNYDSLLTQLAKDKITHIYYNLPYMNRVIKDRLNGKSSVIIDKKNIERLELEYNSGKQYLYRIKY